MHEIAIYHEGQGKKRPKRIPVFTWCSSVADVKTIAAVINAILSVYKKEETSLNVRHNTGLKRYKLPVKSILSNFVVSTRTPRMQSPTRTMRKLIVL